MARALSYALVHLPYATGCQFKPRTIGFIEDYGHVHCWGGFVSLHLVASGTADISWRDQNRKLKPGDMFCLLPDVKVRYTNTPDAPWSFYWCDIQGPAAERIAHEAGFSAENVTRTDFSNRHLLRKKFENIHSAARLNEEDPRVYASLILDLLSFLHIKKVNRPSSETIADEFENLLNDPRNINMGVSDFAYMLHCDRTSLFHACKTCKNISPVRLLVRRKIEYCKELLRTYPEYPLNKIASMTGFANDVSMCQAFKRETSMTPAAYRRKA